jgi:hypothetical protein
MWYVKNQHQTAAPAPHAEASVPQVEGISVMKDNELKKAIAKTYWKAEQRWQIWRAQHREDSRNGIDYSGSPEEDGIATDWRACDVLFKEWESRHPVPAGYFWGIEYPSHEPVLYESAHSDRQSIAV